MFSISEKDWRVFKERIPRWQERHMERLNQEYVEILTGDGIASKKFWEIEKRINKDKKSAGVITRMARSNAFPCILELLADEIITDADLEGFSDDLMDAISFVRKNIWSADETEQE